MILYGRIAQKKKKEGQGKGVSKASTNLEEEVARIENNGDRYFLSLIFFNHRRNL